MEANRKLFAIGIAAPLAMVVLGVSSPALAIQQFVNPFGDNVPVQAYINKDPGDTFQWINWKNLNTGECSFSFLGGSAGFSDNVQVNGGSAGDSIVVMTGNTPFSFCGFNMVAPIFNGFGLSMFGHGGNDFLVADVQKPISLNGGTGNDYLRGVAGSSGFEAIGEDGNDSIRVNGSGAASAIAGDDGNDCLRVATTVSPSVMVCGSGTDTWSGPGTRPFSCESTSTTLCPGEGVD